MKTASYFTILALLFLSCRSENTASTKKFVGVEDGILGKPTDDLKVEALDAAGIKYKTYYFSGKGSFGKKLMFSNVSKTQFDNLRMLYGGGKKLIHNATATYELTDFFPTFAAAANGKRFLHEKLVDSNMPRWSNCINTAINFLLRDDSNAYVSSGESFIQPPTLLQYGTEVDRENLKYGDLIVVWYETGSSYKEVSHAAVFVEGDVVFERPSPAEFQLYGLGTLSGIEATYPATHSPNWPRKITFYRINSEQVLKARDAGILWSSDMKKFPFSWDAKTGKPSLE